MNARQRFTVYLRGLDPSALSAVDQRATRRLRQARNRGDCALAATLYFDLAQVKNEMQRRETL